MSLIRTRTKRDRTAGQSLVEVALVIPVLLLIVMMGIDFGRVFLGWVNLNNTARIAANFAAANATLMASGNSAAEATYQQLVSNDLSATNCKPDPFPDPTFPDGTDLGDRAHVAVTCQFQLLTPIIGNVLGAQISVSASSDFPIRTGILAGVPGGAGGVTAQFNMSPTGGTAPLTVTFSDVSTGSITSWAWDFNGDGVIDSTTSGPQTYTYTIADVYHPSLTVSDGVTTDKMTRTITIANPPGPVVQFTALPAIGTSTTDAVVFTNTSTGSGTLTYSWDFGDGTTSTAQTPPSKFYAAGTWTITLTVTDGVGQSNSGTATITRSAPIPQCAIPNFKNVTTSNAVQTTWVNAGFNTTVIFNPSRPPEYKITKQSLTAGSQQPCSGTVITVFDH